MKTTKTLIIFPLIVVGYAIGFVWESIAIGIHAGKSCVDNIGSECAEKKRKGDYENSNLH